MAKLPVKLSGTLSGVPVKMSSPTGENAKGTGENGGRTSEEPLIEPLNSIAPPSSSFGNSDVVAPDNQKEEKEEVGERGPEGPKSELIRPSEESRRAQVAAAFAQMRAAGLALG
jgi:hypothetical protein